MKNKILNKWTLSLILVLLLFIPLISASTSVVKGYVLDAEDGTSANGLRIQAINEFGKIQYDTIGINGNSRNYNQYQFTLQGNLKIKVIENNEYYSDEIEFKTTTNKYDFVKEIKLKKTSSYEKLGYEPFTISEKTEYGFTENTIYVDVTNNLPTDETINIYHLFNKNYLTEKINYNSIEILEEVEEDYYETVISEIPINYTLKVDKKDVEVYNNITEKIEIVKLKVDKYYDKDGKELKCDEIKNKTKEYNNETEEKNKTKEYIEVCYNEDSVYMGKVKVPKFQDKTKKTILRQTKPISSKQKQEYKHSQENIQIKAGETINVRLTYSHANILEQIPTYEQNKYDIMVCTVDKEFCTILDPLWFNESWAYYKEYTNLTGNFTYMEVNKTANDAPGFVDTRFVSCTNESLVFNHTLEATFDGQGLSYNSSISPYNNGNLVSLWKLDNNDLTDLIGSNDLSNVGSVNSSGKILDGRLFDGTNDYLDGNDILDLSTEEPFTIQAWVKDDNIESTTDRVIVGKIITSSPFTGYNLFYRKKADGTRQLAYTMVVSTSSSNYIDGYFDTNISDGEWHLITFTYDGSGSYTGAKIYDNGVEQIRVSGATNPLSGSMGNSESFNVGARADSIQFWKGDIDHVSIYNDSLTQTEIQELYNGQKAQFRLNNKAENCTLRYYGNEDAVSTSSASNTYFEPVSAYYFDANVNDFIGSNHGTVNGATLSSGYINGSYNFDGTDDYIDLGSDNSLNLIGDMSYSVWVYRDTSTSAGVLLARGTNLNSYFWFILTTGYIRAYNGGNFVDSTSQVPYGQWSHIVITYTASSNTINFYINGVLAGSGTNGNTASSSSNTVICTDSRNIGTAGWTLDGKVDEPYIYNKVLTQNQISQLYTQTAPIITEGEEQSQSVAIEVTPPTWETQSGQTSGNLTFLQTTKYINTTSVSNVSYMTLTITDPDSSSRLVENMTNSSLSAWYSDTEFSFDKVGIWTLQVEGFKDDSSATNSTTLTVEITAVSTKDGWFGCSKDKILSSAEIDTLITYDCDLVELSENSTAYKTNNETLKTAINDSKNRFIKTGINIVLDFDLNSTLEKDSALINVSNVLSDFTIPPYTDAIEYISLEIKNPENYNTSIKNSVINEFAENLTSAIENQFVIYSKNYNNASLDSSYISFTSFFYLDNLTQSSLMEQENIILRNNAGLNRMYVSLNDTLMLQTQSYQNNILDNLRGSPTGSTTIPTTNVAEINSDINDIVVFNKESTNQSYQINVTSVSEMLNKDVWDSAFGYLVEKDTDGIFIINSTAYSANNIFMDDFSHIQYGSTKSTLFKAIASEGGHFNYTNGTKYDIYGMYGANDASIELWDSTYKSNTFIDYYGWFNVSYVTNWSRYDIIIFDDENTNEVSRILGETESKEARMFGYIAVADYENTDAWVTGKKAEIDNILALNESTRLHIFIDGLDYQVAGVNFSNRVKELVDYIKIENNRDVGLNTYTAYQDFCSWSKPGGFCMRESCVRRWDGTVGDPTYSWENWTLELEKSAWFNSHGVQVMCQAFGNKTTSGENRIENHTILQDAYFASLVLGYTDFYMSQPDFQYAHEINLYDVGTDLANTYSVHAEDNSTYYRRYSNGIVYYNTTSNKGWIDDGREFDGITICFNLIDGSDAVDAEGINFAFNVNGGNYYEIPASEIVWSANGNWYCEDLNSSDYSEDGYYYIQMKPHDRNPTSGHAIYLSNSINQEGTGRKSFYDNTAGGEPFTWNAYEQDKNWMVDIEINQTKSTSSDNTNIITQSVTSDSTQTNLTLSSPYHQDIEVRSTFIEHDMSNFGNLTYWNGTDSIVLNYTNNTECSSNNPTFSETTINGEIHKACLNNNGFRIATPHLSTQIYFLELDISDVSAPELSTTYPLNTTYIENVTNINFEVNDTDGNLDSCWYNLGSENVTTNCSLPITGITSNEGINTWKVYANDTFGNTNVSIVTFTVDTTSPVITIINPVSSINEKTQPVNFRVNISEEGYCNAEIYGTNYSMTTSDNISFSYSKVLEVGFNSVIFYCSDFFSHSSSSSIDFYLSPTVSGGGSVGTTVIYEVPEEPEVVEEEVMVEDKETKIIQIVNDIKNGTQESYEIAKENVTENWVYYLAGLIAILILIFVIIFI